MKDKKINQNSDSKSHSNLDSAISQNNSTSYFQNITGHSNSNVTSILSLNNKKLEDGNSSINKSQIKTQYKFISKLVELLDTPDISDVISWNNDGTIIEIKDQRKFVDQILPQHFKHNNFSNFVRQLNMYHFKKVKNYITSGVIAYSNQYFIKGCSNLLSEINRRNQGGPFQVNKELSIFDNDTVKDDTSANKMNFLFNRLFDLENKVKALTNVNDNLLSNNLTFMEDLKDKSYYINMLESLIFYIVNNLLPNNIEIKNDNLYNNTNSTYEYKNIKNYVCTCENNNNYVNKDNIFKDKIQDDYFNSPNSPNSSSVNLNNLCKQGTLSALNSFNFGNLNEFIISNQSFLSNNPDESFKLITNKEEKQNQSNNNLELNDNANNNSNTSRDIKENNEDVKKQHISNNLNNIVLKLNEEKDELIQVSDSFKKTFCDKCFLQQKLTKTPGLGSFYYKYKNNYTNNNENSTANNSNNFNCTSINDQVENDKYKINSSGNNEDFFKVILRKYKEYNKSENLKPVLGNNNKFPQLPSSHVKLKRDLLPSNYNFDRNIDVNLKVNSSFKESSFKKLNNSQTFDVVCKPQPIKLKIIKAHNDSINPINQEFSTSSDECN